MSVDLDRGITQLTKEETEGLTIAQRFEAFRAKNPHIELLLVDRARQAMAAGFRHLSVDFLYHQLRWDWAIRTNRPDQFKLNDHFTSRYARLLPKIAADLEDLFETRRLRRP